MKYLPLALLGASLAAPALATGRDAGGFPSHAITIVVPFAAGGSTDTLARSVAQKLGERLGATVVVENKAGAAGAIGAQAVAAAAPDGHTLLVATTSTHSILPALRKLPYDSDASFEPVIGLGTAPNVLVVSPTLPVANIAEFIRYAKQNPGKLSFSSSGAGTITHLIGENFKLLAGIDAVHIPYKTGVQAVPDITSGRVSFAFDSVVWTLPQARQDKVKALAITSAARSPLAAELPTLSESGLSGFEGITWFGIMAPKGVPAPVVGKLNTEINAILRDSAIRKQLEAQGAEPMGGPPARLSALMRAEAEKWQSVIKAAKITLE